MKKANKKELMRTDQSTTKAPKLSPCENYNYNTTNTGGLSIGEPYRTILSLIRKGEQNAVHTDVLINATGKSERDIRKCIEQLRRSGSVIASSCNGYYIPDSVYEIKKYIIRETQRATNIFRTIKSARELLKTLDHD